MLIPENIKKLLPEGYEFSQIKTSVKKDGKTYTAYATFYSYQIELCIIIDDTLNIIDANYSEVADYETFPYIIAHIAINGFRKGFDISRKGQFVSDMNIIDLT